MIFNKFESLPKTADIESPDRRSFMRTAAVGAGAVAAAGAAMTGGSVQEAKADAHMTPIGEKWWPSRWGEGDQAGASNWMTPEKTLDAVKWIKNGKVTRIGRDYEPSIPFFGPRGFALRIPGAPTGGPFGENMLVYNDEYLATEIGQVGTQFDGLGHIGAIVGSATDKADHRYYNGFTGAEVEGAYGLQKIGMEHVKPFFTRGHLIDVKPQQAWDVGNEITPAHVDTALAAQGMSLDDIKEGDAVFFNTGWGDLWIENNDRFNSGCPGIGMDVAAILVDKGVCLVGGDTWPVEVVPNPDPKRAFVVHNELITRNGIYIHENLVFDDLIADGAYQFVYVFAPLPIKGGTGSIGNPIAIT